MENIHPIFDQILTRHDKEKLLGQKALVLWMTGLSGSGKSTLAKGLEKKLHHEGHLTKLLDGDNVRTGLCNNLTFSEEDRMENIRRVAEVSKLFLDCGVITVNSFISPTRSIRSMAQNIIGKDDFCEIYVNCPIEVCESRDVKGLYKKARQGEIKDFTGIHSDFEEPLSPAIEIRTDLQTIEDSIQQLYDFLIQKISFTDVK